MNTPFQIGDQVVLTGEDCYQPAPELMAIWTVEQLTPPRMIIILNPDVQIAELDLLAQKCYPFNRLVLYIRARQ